MKIKGLGLKRLVVSQCILEFLFAVLIIAATASSSYSASSDWKPVKNVELIVGSSPGGGLDEIARMVQMVWQQKSLVKPSSTVLNKPGGGMAIAINYGNQHVGDGHYLMFTSATFLTNRITGITTVNYTDVTPIAIVGIEPVIFTVRADSPIKTGKDLIDRLKKDPKSLSTAIATARGGTNHIAMAMVAKETGVNVKDLKVVVFDSTADSTMALLGGHVDLVTSTATAVAEHAEAGKVRIIAVASEKRLPGKLAGVPTWREQGINSISANTRTVVGPKGMTQAQLAYWDDKFLAFVQTAEWKKWLVDNLAETIYLNSGESKKFLEAQYGQFKAVLTDLGLAK